MCVCVYLSEAVVVDEVGSVSVDQGVEGQTVLPAVGAHEHQRSFTEPRLTCRSWANGPIALCMLQTLQQGPVPVPYTDLWIIHIE